MVQIKSISVIQTALVLSIVYAVVSIPFVLLLALGSLFTGHLINMILVLLTPLLYLILGFITTAFLCFIYNLVAERMGGIEIELQGTETEVRS